MAYTMNSYLDRPPTFIIGGSRTGSEMLKTMLSASPDLDFVDELFLFCPRWLHRDLASNIRAEVGDLSGLGAVDRVLELLFSGKPYGWVWGVAEEQFDRQRLRELLVQQPVSMRSIFDALMVAHAERRGKSGRGAKFPMHYSRSHQLITWYPDCRLLHTVRDPRAVYASQANKYIAPHDGYLMRAGKKLQQFLHINIQTTWTAALHKQLSTYRGYKLVRYEDVVRDPEAAMRDICEFLGVPFLDAMLSPKQYGSSYEQIRDGHGIDQSSLEAWRDRTSGLTSRLIRAIHPRAWRLFGYQA